MKRIALFVLLFFLSVSAYSASTNELLTASQYNRMEPYMNNEMRAKLKPADAKYTNDANKLNRRVVSRSAVTSMGMSRSAIKTNSGRSTPVASSGRRVVSRSAARSATKVSSGRRVVARSAVSSSNVRSASSTRGTSNRVSSTESVGSRSVSVITDSAANTLLGDGTMTTAQCLSNYSNCMDDYCHRSNTKYDRCYCSAKLAALDAEYKPQIDGLIKQIAILQNGGEIENGMTQEEINELWQDLFGATGENSMAQLDAALDIDWTDTENSVRGQNAFVAGDNFCKQQLSNCFYMSENLKSMYRTSIGQDCAAYEYRLKKTVAAAESIVESYK